MQVSLEAQNSLQSTLLKAKAFGIVEHQMCSKHQAHNNRKLINDL
jgi:hypothetical protein